MGAAHELRGDVVERLLELGPADRAKVVEAMSDEDKAALLVGVKYDWNLWARPEQRPPAGSWDTWIMLAGRGGGKTRPGSQTVSQWARDVPLIALMAKDDAMVRDVMIEGDSGILACSPPWWYPEYDRTKLRLTWPNGSKAIKLTAEAGADAARGRQFYKAWAEEVATWPHVRDAWNEGLQNAVRLGQSPQTMVTTTPKGFTAGVRPEAAAFLVDLFLGPKDRSGNRPVTPEEMASNRWSYSVTDKDGVVHRTVIVRWSTDRNAANVAPGFAEKRRQQYGVNTRMAAQELDAEILEKVEGALWTFETLDRCRVEGVPTLTRVEVAVDPTRSEAPVDEAGIVAGGMSEGGHAYVLEDATVRGTPEQWFSAAVNTYRKHRADALVYEKNRMGQMVRDMARSYPDVRLKEVHASEGKRPRAEPVSALYEQGKVHHVGFFVLLEDEMLSWDPNNRASPNRMDALVWLVTSLLLGDRRAPLRLV